MGYKEFLKSVPPPTSSTTARTDVTSRSTTSDKPASLSVFERLLGKSDLAVTQNDGSSRHTEDANSNNPDYGFNVMATTILNGSEDHPHEPRLLDSSSFSDISTSLIREAVRVPLFVGHC